MIGTNLTRAWAFDVDGCLVDSQTGTDLRPGAAALLAAVRSSGARVLVWSAGGADYARDRLVDAGVDQFVDVFLSKDRRGPDGRYRWDAEVELPAVVFVDDHPEDLPVGAEVLAVSPYIAANPHDRGLAAAWSLLAADDRAGTRKGAPISEEPAPTSRNSGHSIEILSGDMEVT